MRTALAFQLAIACTDPTLAGPSKIPPFLHTFVLCSGTVHPMQEHGLPVRGLDVLSDHVQAEQLRPHRRDTGAGRATAHVAARSGCGFTPAATGPTAPDERERCPIADPRTHLRRSSGPSEALRSVPNIADLVARAVPDPLPTQLRPLEI